jgi:hypothetical protein
MWVGKNRSIPYSGALGKGFPRAGFSLTHTHQLSFERSALDKKIILLPKFVNYNLGVQKLMGENLKVVLPRVFNFKLCHFVMYSLHGIYKSMT